MKNSSIILFFSVLLVSFLSISTSTAQSQLTQHTDPIALPGSEMGKCQVAVLKADGSLAKRIEIKTMPKGTSCDGETFMTNEKGVATLRWEKGCHFTKISVRGKEFEVKYRSGGMYTIEF